VDKFDKLPRHATTFVHSFENPNTDACPAADIYYQQSLFKHLIILQIRIRNKKVSRKPLHTYVLPL
jgi:hypothetical protein